MSRRCRNSLGSGGTLTGGDLSSGCDCGRLVGKKPAVPCVEPLVYGELLRDPGFELTADLEAMGGRLNLPRYDNFDPSNPSRGPGWEWEQPSPEDPGFVPRSELLPWWSANYQSTLITTDVHTGTYALEHVVLSEAEGFITSGNTIGCSSTFEEAQPLFRAELGDLVTISCMAADNFGDGRMALQLLVLGRRPNGGSATPPPVVGDEVPITSTNYVKFTASGFVADPQLAWLEPRWSPELLTNVSTVRFDNMSLILIPASATGILLCAQSSLITIDNSTTETAFL